jgi:hypothetical protein
MSAVTMIRRETFRLWFGAIFQSRIMPEDRKRTFDSPPFRRVERDRMSGWRGAEGCAVRWRWRQLQKVV